jgi:2-dehydropantoate 2-reductase
MLNINGRVIPTKKIRKVSIIGLGAIGAAYASKIYDSSIQLQVIVDNERLARYKLDKYKWSALSI